MYMYIVHMYMYIVHVVVKYNNFTHAYLHVHVHCMYVYIQAMDSSATPRSMPASPHTGVGGAAYGTPPSVGSKTVHQPATPTATATIEDTPASVPPSAAPPPPPQTMYPAVPSPRYPNMASPQRPVVPRSNVAPTLTTTATTGGGGPVAVENTTKPLTNTYTIPFTSGASVAPSTSAQFSAPQFQASGAVSLPKSSSLAPSRQFMPGGIQQQAAPASQMFPAPQMTSQTTGGAGTGGMMNIGGQMSQLGGQPVNPGGHGTLPGSKMTVSASTSGQMLPSHNNLAPNVQITAMTSHSGYPGANLLPAGNLPNYSVSNQPASGGPISSQPISAQSNRPKSTFNYGAAIAAANIAVQQAHAQTSNVSAGLRIPGQMLPMMSQPSSVSISSQSTAAAGLTSSSVPPHSLTSQGKPQPTAPATAPNINVAVPGSRPPPSVTPISSSLNTNFPAAPGQSVGGNPLQPGVPSSVAGNLIPGQQQQQQQQQVNLPGVQSSMPTTQPQPQQPQPQPQQPQPQQQPYGSQYGAMPGSQPPPLPPAPQGSQMPAMAPGTGQQQPMGPAQPNPPLQPAYGMPPQPQVQCTCTCIFSLISWLYAGEQ